MPSTVCRWTTCSCIDREQIGWHGWQMPKWRIYTCRLMAMVRARRAHQAMRCANYGIPLKRCILVYIEHWASTHARIHTLAEESPAAITSNGKANKSSSIWQINFRFLLLLHVSSLQGVVVHHLSHSYLTRLRNAWFSSSVSSTSICILSGSSCLAGIQALRKCRPIVALNMVFEAMITSVTEKKNHGSIAGRSVDNFHIHNNFILFNAVFLFKILPFLDKNFSFHVFFVVLANLCHARCQQKKNKKNLNLKHFTDWPTAAPKRICIQNSCRATMIDRMIAHVKNEGHQNRNTT